MLCIIMLPVTVWLLLTVGNRQCGILLHHHRLLGRTPLFHYQIWKRLQQSVAHVCRIKMNMLD